MKEIECEGKTVILAVESALKQLGLRREQVEVLVMQEGSGGILGFGAKPARVKITEKHWGKAAPEKPSSSRGGRKDSGPAPRRSGDYPPAEMPSRDRGESARPSAPRRCEPQREARPQRSGNARPEHRADAPRHEPRREPRPEPRREPRREARRELRPERGVPTAPLTQAQCEAACQKSTELLKEVLPLMLFDDAKITSLWDSKQERVKSAIETGDHKRLIGQEGRTLEALQFLITLMVGRRLGSPVAVQVDTQGYWQDREDSILSEARKGVETVRTTGKPFRMPPMDPQMRRLIHRSLAGDPDIVTSSEGDGAWRKIVLRPSK